MIFLIALFFLLVFQNSSVYGGTFTVDYTNHVFLKDGKPFKYISGSFHYFRVHPEQWDDRLKRVRAMGLNAIQTYVPWNLHQPTEDTFDFSGIANITRFLTLAQQNGLYVLLRQGPYITAEWEMGGLPWWLLKYDKIGIRTSDANYTNAVKKYFNVLLPIIKPFLYKNGGPILMSQLENEYGYFAWHDFLPCDHNYTTWLRDLTWSILGNDVVLYTTDPPINITEMQCGLIPNVTFTVDFQPAPNTTIDQHFGMQDNISGGGLDYIHNAKDGSINFYIIQAGTHFDFWSCNYVATTYWYNAALADNGDITEKFWAIRNLIGNFTDWEYPPTTVPSNVTMANYGQVILKDIGSNLINTLTTIQQSCVQSEDPITFENLDYGYRGVLAKGNQTTTTLAFSTTAQPGDILRILVENNGRACNENQFHLDNKGLSRFAGQNVHLEGKPLQNWFQCGINMTLASINSLTKSLEDTLNTVDSKESYAAASQPGVFYGTFTANEQQDTYLDTTGWGKGNLFMNGYNLGRYWPKAGPQMTLYVPKPVLQETNTVLLIELQGTQQNYVNLIDHPIFLFQNDTIT